MADRHRKGHPCPIHLTSCAAPANNCRKKPPDANELVGLLRSGAARLKDARHATLALESQFDLAYNAAHSLSLAALRRMGYRAGNRFIVFQVLPHTLGLGPEVWRVLDKCHKLRNLGEYEGLPDVDERLVKDLITATQAVADALGA